MPFRIYISGPMTGYDLTNFPMFEATTRVLRRSGWDVVTPTETDIEMGMVTIDRNEVGDIVAVTPTEAWNYEAMLEQDLEDVRTCSHILLLPGWENSSGAKRELAAALSVNASIILYKEMFTDALV